MNKDWEDYRVFLAVMRKGGFAAAAPGLNMVTATVKRHIERLETSLGAPLFDRGARPLALTAAGLALKPVPESMESAQFAFTEAAMTERQVARGIVRVLAPEVLGQYVLPPLFARLRRSHPEILIDLDMEMEPGAGEDGHADLVLTGTAPRSGDRTCKDIGQIPFGLFGRRDLLDRIGRPKSVKDLEQLPIIGLRSAAYTRMAYGMLGLSLPDAATRFRSHTTAGQFSAVLSGLGVGLCQAPLAARHPELERILPEVGRALPLCIAMHKSQADVLRVRVVMDAIVAEVRAYLGVAGAGRMADLSLGSKVERPARPVARLSVAMVRPAAVPAAAGARV